jgi:ribosomally synthesized peptide (two-chain TOMM family)
MSRNNAIPDQEAMIKFSEIYLLAIELSWRDPKFKEELIKRPLWALQHYFHYSCPWNIRIEVNTPEVIAKKWQESQQAQPEWGWKEDTTQKGKWSWVLPKNGMSFGLPTAPKNIEERPVALALYNDAGPMYLFSCC